MTVLVVTGTGTGVGKTAVTAALASLAVARGAGVAVVKPVQTGEPGGASGDLAEVTRLAGPTVVTVEPARFPEPLSPAAAARRAGRRPYALRDAVPLVQQLADRHRLVVVEGAGGLLVRYDEDGTTVADLARWLGAPCVVVVQAALGTLNHTALTLEAMAHRGLDLAGVVVGAWPVEPDLAALSNVRDLETLAARPLSGALAAGCTSLGAEAFTAAARAGLGPELGGSFDAADFRRRAVDALDPADHDQGRHRGGP